MDFPPPRRALEAGIAILDRGDTGYPSPDLTSNYQASYQEWAKKNFGTRPHSLTTVADVVAALRIIVMAVTDPGAGVIVLTPSYPPFFRVVNDAERELVLVPMQRVNRRYSIDFDLVAKAAAGDNVQAIILCNPQNPTGRVFTREELTMIADIAESEELTVISDEIHQDLRAPDTVHIPFTSLDHESSNRAVVLGSPSKSFNIAGLKVAHIELPNDTGLRARIEGSPLLALSQATSIGLSVGAQAYRTEGDWLDEVRTLIDGNFDLVKKGLGDQDFIKLTEREGTYLLWGELLRYPSHQSAYEFLLDRAQVAVGPGEDYLPGAPEFFRVNLAAWPSVVETMIERIHDALAAL
jgi:cystathionine beta-lyase